MLPLSSYTLPSLPETV